MIKTNVIIVPPVYTVTEDGLPMYISGYVQLPTKWQVTNTSATSIPLDHKTIVFIK